MMHFFGRLVGLVTIALVMPLWVEAAELSSQPIDEVRFEPKLVLDIKAKSMAGGILLWNKDVNPGGPQY